MIRILLVDDETKIRSIIASQINRTADYCVTAQASDGLEALQRIEEHMPDIVVTDIAMPNYDGLFLAKTIQDQWPLLKVVIISGYDNFEYARKAMRYGVRDYILKPFMIEDLIAVFTRLKEEIDSLSRKPNDISFQRHEFLSALTRGTDLSTKEIMDACGKLGILLHQNNFSVAIANCYAGREPDFSLRPTVLRKTKDLIKEGTDDSLHAVFFTDTSSRLVVIFSHSLGERDYEKKIDSLLSSIHAKTTREFSSNVVFALSRTVGTFLSIKDAYREAETLWMLRFETEGCIDRNWHHPDSAEEKRLTSEEASIREKILLSTFLGKSEADSLLISYFHILSRLGFLRRKMPDSLIVGLADSLSARIRTEGNGKYFDQIHAICFNKNQPYANLWQLCSLLRKALSAYLEEKAKEDMPQSRIIVDHIVNRVSENIGNPAFSVENAIAGLSYSSSYIRYVFTQEMKTSIKEYLTMRRMERAKELLRDPTISIKMIAEQSGFQNQRYFASTFRNYLGCSPSAFREKETGAKEET